MVFARRKQSGYARLGKMDFQRPVHAAKKHFRLVRPAHLLHAHPSELHRPGHHPSGNTTEGKWYVCANVRTVHMHIWYAHMYSTVHVQYVFEQRTCLDSTADMYYAYVCS